MVLTNTKSIVKSAIAQKALLETPQVGDDKKRTLIGSSNSPVGAHFWSNKIDFGWRSLTRAIKEIEIKIELRHKTPFGKRS